MSVYDLLQERGFLKQLSHEEEIKEYWKKKKLLFILVLTPRQTAFTLVTL